MIDYHIGRTYGTRRHGFTAPAGSWDRRDQKAIAVVDWLEANIREDDYSCNVISSSMGDSFIITFNDLESEVLFILEWSKAEIRRDPS